MAEVGIVLLLLAIGIVIGKLHEGRRVEQDAAKYKQWEWYCERES